MKKETVVITGAGSGLGASLASKYASSGSHVCLLGRTRAKLSEVASKLDGEYSIYEVDVTSKINVSKVMKKIRQDHGRIDCLINNAGVGIFKSIGDLEEKEIHQMIDTNLKGTIFCTQEVLEDMKEKNKGQLVNIISNSGKEAKATESIYSASKFGVRGFVDAIALELVDSNIQIYSAYMGNMRTNLWGKELTNKQLDRFMNPDDVAEIIIVSLKSQNHPYVKDITISQT